MVPLPKPPFVLLDDARRDGADARLYRDPVEIVRADTPAEVAPALARLRAGCAGGKDAAGYLAYGAGAGLDAAIAPHAGPGPLLWFGLFDGYESIAADAVPGRLPDPEGAWPFAPEPRIDEDAYRAAFARVSEWIAAGDIYQANLTFRADVRFEGDWAALYALLRAESRAGYGALIDTGETRILSFSPELFFRLDGDRVEARPMKGTARRDADPARDRAAAATLAEDPKQRAENLMIVDLMRNDLARICRPGSVAVPRLFEVERYPTVHQMVSSVTGNLRGDCDAIDALSALFPCGSVTGAPKLRAIEVIDAVEPDARGLYTGAIGRIDASGDAMFNVAIRTLTMAPGADRATMGLGSGVVADSNAREEWDECLAKGAFVTAGRSRFDLIETMRFDPLSGIALLERHLTRMKESARALGFEFDRHAARNELQAATFRIERPAKVRLMLAPSGAIAIGIAPLPQAPERPVSVKVVPMPEQVAPDDFRRRHKTSRRGFYDEARAASGAWEVVFTDSDGTLTEGSFTSIFVPRGDLLVTPPLAGGLIPGVLRAELIESGRAVEGVLTPDDLRDGFFVGNALRGLVSAVTVAESAHAAV